MFAYYVINHLQIISWCMIAQKPEPRTCSISLWQLPVVNWPGVVEARSLYSLVYRHLSICTKISSHWFLAYSPPFWKAFFTHSLLPFISPFSRILNSSYPAQLTQHEDTQLLACWLHSHSYFIMLWFPTTSLSLISSLPFSSAVSFPKFQVQDAAYCHRGFRPDHKFWLLAEAPSPIHKRLGHTS